MHKEILNSDQQALLPLLKDFKNSFYLVGGTAIALHIGHRRSIDFDLFKSSALNPKKILEKISANKFTPIITRRVSEQLNLIVQNVKFTFFQYPFTIPAKTQFGDYINLPSLLDLAAMKAYALGRRSKWKDYVDLYFILTKYHDIGQIANRGNEIFGELFSEKQFRAQLCYFGDIDYEEKVEFLNEVPSIELIKKTLTEISVNFR